MEAINEATKDKLLEKILNSTEFCSSHIYGKYLTYLVNASLENKNLKETSIAFEFFEKDADFNPAEDTIVRSHTYNLRKKLEKYYFTEGKSDAYRINIPKGHYQVEIVPYQETKLSPKYYLNKILRLYPFILLLLASIVLIVLFSKNRALNRELEAYQLIDRNDFIWKEYLHSEIPIMIVTGDHFMFNLYSDKYQREFSIRDVTINSEDDLDAFKINFKEPEIQETPEPYFPYHSIWSLPPIYAIFLSNKQYPILRKSSSITPQMLGEYNIIFVGSIKTLYALKHTITNSNFDFEIAPHKVYFTLPDSGTVKEFKTNLHSSGPNEDLVLALKLPGPSGNCIMIIASYHSLGAPEIAKYLTNPETRTVLEQKFEEKYQYLPQYFEILFRVVGIDKTAYNTNILIANEIVL